MVLLPQSGLEKLLCLIGGRALTLSGVGSQDSIRPEVLSMALSPQLSPGSVCRRLSMAEVHTGMEKAPRGRGAFSELRRMEAVGGMGRRPGLP